MVIYSNPNKRSPKEFPDVFGTPGNDKFDSVLGVSRFVGEKQNLFTSSGNDTVVKALGRELAILQNVQASSLTANNFVFA